MITRNHESSDIVSEAVYSDCETYRYRVSRRWNTGRLLNFIMLNPSVADEKHNDPTVERCERRARMLGFGAFTVTNIFAWRDTDPSAMRKASQPVGPDNDPVLLDAAACSDQVIAAWGTHGAHQERGETVARMLRRNSIPLYHLGLSKHGHPRHPLYVSYTQGPVLWHPPQD